MAQKSLQKINNTKKLLGYNIFPGIIKGGKLLIRIYDPRKRSLTFSKMT